MSLYQKYRPKDFSSLVGQTFVKQALTSALWQRKTVGAYLFCGSRGTGKTSVARILAKSLNCIALTEEGDPCGTCIHCEAFARWGMLDVIEIDAASNTGVDNIREMIEKAQFQPNQGTYKIYIIDEVHMLSKWAFDALLKTLEEPPAHVKFILATTEIHKIPETILSRCQRYDFRKISEIDIVARLAYVAKNENIQAEDRALSLIARLAKWGLRDALTLFEQYGVGGKLSYDFITENLSLVGDEFIDQIIRYILAGDRAQILVQLEMLRSRSIDPRRYIEEFLFILRDRLMGEKDTLVFQKLSAIFQSFSTAYSRLRDFPDGGILVEITTLSCVFASKEGWDEVRAIQKSEISRPDTPSVIQKTPQIIEKEIISIPKLPQKDIQKEEVLSPPISGDSPVDFSIVTLIERLRKEPKTAILVTALKTGVFQLKDTYIEFFVGSFDQKKLDIPELRWLVAWAITECFWIHREVRFGVMTGKKWTISVDDAVGIF